MGIGPTELAIIALLVLIVFGVGKLGNVGGALGKSIKEFRHEVGSSEEAREDKPAS